MENSLLIGLSRQISLQRELDVVANNVANMNTTGYKAGGAVFEEFLMPLARANQFQRGGQRVSFVQDRATFHDFGNGPIRQTGNPLDVAIDGDAFLVVQTPRGERFTRNGAMQINNAGTLVNSSGDPIMGDGGPIQFQAGDRDISISESGTITARNGANATESPRGKLRLVSFAQTQRLQSDGASTFTSPNDMQPQPAAGNVRVVQSAIEQSNVRGVVEMSRMIEVSRSYSQVAALLQQQGDMRRSSIERLAEVPA